MKRLKRWAGAVMAAAVFAVAAGASQTARADGTSDAVHKVENVVCDALSELNPIIAAICSLVDHHGAAQLALLADADGDGKPDGDPKVIADLDKMGKEIRNLMDAETKRIMHGLHGPAHKALDWLNRHVSPFHHHHAAPAAGGGS